MKDSYKYISDFIDGYAFVKDFFTGTKGVVDKKGNVIIPVIYDGFIGDIRDKVIIGYIEQYREVNSVVDWDNEDSTHDVYVGNKYYLLDKEGNSFFLDFLREMDYINPKFKYGGSSLDRNSGFEFKVECDRKLDFLEKDIFFYMIYSGSNFYIVDKHGPIIDDHTSILYFDGTVKEIDSSYISIKRLLEDDGRTIENTCPCVRIRL